MTWIKEPCEGDVYEGDWKNDQRTGKGILKYHDGDVYEGEFNKGKKEGKGTMKYKDAYLKENGKTIKEKEKEK